MSIAKQVALGGVMAAVATVIMCLCGLIPIATFVCPILCIILCAVINDFLGKKIGCCWYVAVSVLSLLIGPDKEAAAIFAALGYYPIIKSCFERTKFGWLLKTIFFNLTIILLYGLIIWVLGIWRIANDYKDLGIIGLMVMFALGNLTFFLVDRLLTIFSNKRNQYGK